MKERKTITISALLYSMLRRWVIIVTTFVIVLVIGTGYVIHKNGAQTEESDMSTTLALLDERNRATVEGYRTYIENSAYMNLDPNNVHIRYIHYYINWKEEGVDPAAFESKYAELFSYMTLYYPSDEFVDEINEAKPEYKDKALYEILGIGRSGNDVTFTLVFTDDSYLKDMGDIIDATLKKKTPEWISKVGAFELTMGPVTDKPVDGFQSGYKSGQDSKRGLLSSNQQAIENAATVNKLTQDAPLSKQIMIVIIFALLLGIVAGWMAAIFGQRFDTATDIYDITGEEVLCIFKNEKETVLDRWFYKKNDKYHDPELYLSIAERKMANEGVGKVYLYNCSDADLSDVAAKIGQVEKTIKMTTVEKGNERDFFLDMKEKEEVIVLVKGQVTEKRRFLRMREHFNDLGIKIAGVVFAV